MLEEEVLTTEHPEQVLSTNQHKSTEKLLIDAESMPVSEIRTPSKWFVV